MLISNVLIQYLRGCSPITSPLVTHFLKKLQFFNSPSPLKRDEICERPLMNLMRLEGNNWKLSSRYCVFSFLIKMSKKGFFFLLCCLFHNLSFHPPISLNSFLIPRMTTKKGEILRGRSLILSLFRGEGGGSWIL